MGGCCSCARRGIKAYDGFDKNVRLDNTEMIQETLMAHNRYRMTHNVKKVVLNHELNSTAQDHANHMAKTGNFAHSRNRSYKGKPLGENIAMQWTSDNAQYTGNQATKHWYDEVKSYNFKRKSNPGTGHFTQLVWKNSEQIGVGRARSIDGQWYVVVNYSPAGNFVGEHANNVFPALTK